MVNKNFYLDGGTEKLLDRMMELNPQFNASNWLKMKLQEDVDRLTPKKEQPHLGSCHYPRWKEPKPCSAEVCPTLKSKAIGDGEIAINREFREKVKCIFRGP